MKRRIANFGVVVYNNDGNIEVAFDKAKRVPKTYDSFVACLEIACLNAIQRVMNKIDKGEGKNGNTNNTPNPKRTNPNN